MTARYPAALTVADPPAPVALATLNPRLRALLAQARSPATRRAYRTQWHRFDQWCAAQPCRALPADPADVALYLRHRAATGARLATVRASASAVAAVHRATGHATPTAHPLVRDTLQALARLLGAQQRQARGLSPADLVRIEVTAAQPRTGPTGRTESAAVASWRGRVDVALVRTLWDALLRRSEAAALTWGDIERAADGSGRLTVRRAKTDQEGAGTVLYLSAATLAALDAIRPAAAAPETPVFGLAPDTIGRRVKAACQAAGLPAGYSGHSARVGTAQALVRAGASLPEVMQAGRWQSPAMVSRYAAKELAGRGAVARLYKGDET